MSKKRFSFTRLQKEHHTAFGPEKLWNVDYSDGRLLDINLANIDKQPANARFAVFAFVEKKGKGTIVMGWTIPINRTGEELLECAIDEVRAHTKLSAEEARVAVLALAQQYNPEKNYGVSAGFTLEEFQNKTNLLPDVIARVALQDYPETITAKERDKLWDIFPEYVEKHVLANYNHNPETRKKLNGATGRDYLYMLAGHWLTALLGALRTSPEKLAAMLKQVEEVPV